MFLKGKDRGRNYGNLGTLLSIVIKCMSVRRMAVEPSTEKKER